MKDFLCVALSAHVLDLSKNTRGFIRVTYGQFQHVGIFKHEFAVPKFKPLLLLNKQQTTQNLAVGF